MLRLALLFFFVDLRLSRSNSDFKLIYGHVLAQKLTNESTSDVATAVQVAQKAVQTRTNTATLDLQSLTKSRLYYTYDSETPYILQQKYIISNQLFLQKIHITLGFLYTITLTSTEGRDCPRVCHDITITRDLNNEYHVYRHTFAAQLQLSESFADFSKSSVHKQIGASAYVYLKEMHYSGTCTAESEQWTHTMSKGICERALDSTSHLFDASLSERQLPSYRCQGQTGHACALQQHSCGSMPGSLPGCWAIKVATYNVWNLNSHEWEEYSDRIGRLGKLLGSQDLDIIGVQEVRFEASDHTHNQISTLAQFLPHYQYVFQPAMLHMYHINVRTEEGLAILSRYPILHSDYIFLYRNTSDEEDRHQRICLHAEILIPLLGKVHVFVTHLSLSPSAREQSVVELWRYMSKFTGVKILLGDLNAEPQSTPIRFLRGELPLRGVHTDGLQDTWLVGGAGDRSAGLTFSSLTEQPTKRIDYIFLQRPSKDISVITATVLDERDHCSSPCSDHYGVVATIGYH